MTDYDNVRRVFNVAKMLKSTDVMKLAPRLNGIDEMEVKQNLQYLIKEKLIIPRRHGGIEWLEFADDNDVRYYLNEREREDRLESEREEAEEREEDE